MDHYGGIQPSKRVYLIFQPKLAKNWISSWGIPTIYLVGDFNASVSENHMKDFCEMYDLENLISGPTCFENTNNPSSIDVMLTNRKTRSDRHKMTVTVLKTYFKKKRPIKIIIDHTNILMSLSLGRSAKKP